ncbi:MAG: hypothetical protein HY930_02865 [Euryarchaeota archaeon]|nr:hypothetical protein [Euryarchaeota archaeon]
MELFQYLITGLIGLIGVFVGGFITYHVQKRMQELVWNKEYFEKVYVPLHREISNMIPVIKEFQKDLKRDEWDRIYGAEKLDWVLPEELRNDLLNFYATSHKYSEAVYNASVAIKGCVTSELLKIKKRGDMNIGWRLVMEHFILLGDLLPEVNRKTYEEALEEDYNRYKKDFDFASLGITSGKDLFEYLISKAKTMREYQDANEKQRILLKNAERIKEKLDEIIDATRKRIVSS